MKRTLKIIFPVCAAAVIALAGACSTLQPALTPTTSPPTATPMIITAAPPTAAVTPLTTPLSAPGADWQTISVEGAAFSVPPTWQETSPGQWQGPDGFARLEALPGEGAAPATACISEANRDKPARFGAFPEIRDRYQDGVQAGCLILPSDDQPAEQRGAALLLRWPSAAHPPAAHLALAADRMHIEAIAASLRLPDAAASDACDYSVQSQPAQTINEGGLRISEFAVAAAPQGSICNPAKDPLAFNTLAASGEAAERTVQILEGQYSSQRMARLNNRLAAFGIQFRTSEKRFIIDQNGEKLHANLSWIGPLTMNASGTDFRLPVMDGYDGGTFVLSPAGLQRQEGWDILLFDRVFPVFVGDDLFSLAYDYQRYPRQVNNPALLDGFKNGSLIDTWSVSGATPEGGPARGLWSWDGHWLLELPGLFLEDGQNLNERLGYAEMFTWRLIAERPFYFYRQDGLVHLSYDDQTLEPVYDEVIHEPLGGNAVLLRLKAYESGMFFYARRGAVWYYVTVEP